MLSRLFQRPKTDIHFLSAIIFILLFLMTVPAQAARVYLDITSADLKKLIVAIPPIADKNQPDTESEKGRQMADLLGRALIFHGFIDLLPASSSLGQVEPDWAQLGADFLIQGNYDSDAEGMVLEMRLIDTHDYRMAFGKRYRAPWSKERGTILKFADQVIEHFSGTLGVSNTKVAFVSDQSGHKEVYVADVLGDDVRQVTRHRSITVSPRFSPDGGRLAYTSYHRGNPNLYITNLAQSKTTQAVSYRQGLNIAPAWSPDGQSLITTLSKDGNPDLYLMAPNGNILQRLTRNEGINVSASWSPDGKKFAFTSDRSGDPQIYIMDKNTKLVKRLTFEGDDNSTPAWSPNGDLIAYTGRYEGNYHLFVIPTTGGTPTRLTQYWGNYEAPSWSPDGKQIVFTRKRNGKNQLCTLFLGADAIRPLYNLAGNQDYPQWSPRLEY